VRFRIGSTAPTGRRRGVAPAGVVLGSVVAMAVMAVMAVVALLTLGLAAGLVRRLGGRRRARAVPGGDRTRMPGGVPQQGVPAGDTRKGERSYAEVVEAWLLVPVLALAFGAGGAVIAPRAAEARLLVPMDDKQIDHLKAYGLTFWVLTQGQKAEWLLNYRGGSFLLDDGAATEREADVRGVSYEHMGPGDEAAMRTTIADENMEAVLLEKAPHVAVYIPPNTPPWDDAVTLALKYADIPYKTVWDDGVLKGELKDVDWLHLHHEDFTGQHGKFYTAYHNFPWYVEETQVQQAMATKMGFAKISQLKAAVALTIKDYVGKGGFMFGMCSATDTYDIALAAAGLDIAGEIYDGDPFDPLANQKLDFSRTLAFKDFRLEMDPYLYRFSDIDVTMEAAPRGPNAVFTLFDFSAKNDPVPTMLNQDHVNAVPEFLGQSTGFHKDRIKSGVLLLGEVEGTDEVKYLHGQYGRGTFTFLGGHDPEDYQHMVGDPATDLSQYKHSPGYRLILNNVLFPAAEKKKQRT